MKPKKDMAICAYGAAAILQQVQNLKKDWKGVRSASEDIEYVHRMRVATRRFRSTFDIFPTLPAKEKTQLSGKRKLSGLPRPSAMPATLTSILPC